MPGETGDVVVMINTSSNYRSTLGVTVCIRVIMGWRRPHRDCQVVWGRDRCELECVGILEWRALMNSVLCCQTVLHSRHLVMFVFCFNIEHFTHGVGCVTHTRKSIFRSFSVYPGGTLSWSLVNTVWWIPTLCQVLCRCWKQEPYRASLLSWSSFRTTGQSQLLSRSVLS